MKTLLNVLWHFPCMGFMIALFTWVGGAIFYVTILGAPIGSGFMQLGKFYMSPFSYRMIDKKYLYEDYDSDLKESYNTLLMLLYLPLGLIAGVITLCYIIIFTLTIVGIPLALILAKTLSTIINPINKVAVDEYVYHELMMDRARGYINRYNT